MTNRNMVSTSAEPSEAEQAFGPSHERPEPNRTPKPPVAAPEGSAAPTQAEEPLDSPQPKPMIKQGKARGLKTR